MENLSDLVSTFVNLMMSIQNNSFSDEKHVDLHVKL